MNRHSFARNRVKLTSQSVRQLAAKAESEDEIQQRVVNELRSNRATPGVIFHHVPNGGRRSGRQGALFQRMGVLPGVADLQISFPDGRIAFLELKRAGGRLEASQREFLQAMASRGHLTAVAYGFEAALAFLEGWGALRNQARAA